jgi:DNA-binding transcriptional ArsR family regulator
VKDKEAPPNRADSKVRKLMDHENDVPADQLRLLTTRLAEAEQHDVAARIAALGHPLRLALLLAVSRGQRTAGELVALHKGGTTGQLYHHLRVLKNTGWLTSPRQGEYDVTDRSIACAVAALAAVAAVRRPPQRDGEEAISPMPDSAV